MTTDYYTHKGITYRPAIEKDVVGLSFFLENITKENNLNDVFPSDVILSTKVLTELISANQGVILLSLKNDTIVGAIALRKTQIWWSTEEVFINLFFFVTPKYRKKFEIQNELLKRIKIFSDLAGLPILMPVFNKTNNLSKIAKYLNFKGFKPLVISGIYTPQQQQ